MADKSTAKVVQLPHRERPRRGVEVEFLPAALEIIETPASPVGRAVAATIILFFAVALAWACIGRVDIISTATGRVVPAGRVKVIQPFEIGVVRAIHVQEGQAVKAGDVLIELDPTINAAESERVARELTAAELDMARLKATLAVGADSAAQFVPPPGVSAERAEAHRQLLISAVAEYRAKVANLDRQIAQNRANHAGVEATVRKLTVAIPLLQQRVDARKYLVDKGYGAKLQYLQEAQDLVEHEQELQVQKAHLTEADAALAALKEQRLGAEAEFRRTNYNDLTQAEAKAASLKEELVKAEQHQQLQTLTAPVDGSVQQLAVHTVGGVVTPAQQLMVVVPAGSRLEVEAMVSNRDIGFIHPNEPAEIKVDTFNFTRYGLLHGRVQSVSSDAIQRDKPPEKGGSADKPDSVGEHSSEPPGQELVYAARVSLDRTTMAVEDRAVDLTPGMAVTVEIKTGSRRVISYLLSPLLRYRSESLRER